MSEYPCSPGVNAPLAVRYARTDALLLILARRKKTTFLFVDDTRSCVRGTLLASLSMITSVLSFAILLPFFSFCYSFLRSGLLHFRLRASRYSRRLRKVVKPSSALLLTQGWIETKARKQQENCLRRKFSWYVASEMNEPPVRTFHNYKNILNALNSPWFACFVDTCV